MDQVPSDTIGDRGPAFRAFIIVFLVVMVFAISLRFCSRALSTASQNKSRFWWDDWLALAATVFVLGQLSLTLRIVDLGGGKHIWLVPLDNLAVLSKALFATYLVYDTALALAKASALMFLSRVFPRHANPPRFNIAIWIIHSLNIAWYLGIVFGTFFMCDPVQKNWIPTLPGHCGTPSQLYIGSAVPSVTIDLFILILPVPIIWRLHTSRSRKTGITAVFVLGYSSVIVSIGRLATVLTAGDSLNTDFTCRFSLVIKHRQIHTFRLLNAKAYEDEGIPSYYWITAEVPIMILSICLPAMLPLARHMNQHFYQPLKSNLSALVSSNNRSTSNNITGSGHSPTGSHYHTRLPSTKRGTAHTTTDGEVEMDSFRYSSDSRRQILKLSNSQGVYTTDIRQEPMNHEGGFYVPENSIWVNKGVDISHQAK
ncbi:hypothetical protein NUW58_g616 [Xylaria curta]|uniref:Uncharacterized protein n=1 Tax=Xylaria curta TaxID=42375 RepID=A0ACC1PNJ1_9PEZI|nr:hypothetical protein NUW58_g616 [Xylaria curta]